MEHFPNWGKATICTTRKGLEQPLNRGTFPEVVPQVREKMEQKTEQLETRSHPFGNGDLAVLVDVGEEGEGLPDLVEERLSDLVLGRVDLPAAHVTDLVFGPEEVVVGETAVIVQI